MPPKTSTEELIARGSHVTHPERFRDRGLVSDRLEALPERAPAHLPPDAAQCWTELRAAAAPGVLALSDGITLEIAARLLAELRSGKEVPAARLTVLLQALRELGYSPVARTRVAVPWKPADPAPAADAPPSPQRYFS